MNIDLERVKGLNITKQNMKLSENSCACIQLAFLLEAAIKIRRQKYTIIPEAPCILFPTLNSSRSFSF